ncbi:MAG: glycyl radical protein, partial [Lachnospiraceae bacterium]|nr:glycyl radical protein [Lachnospiraceae bacterium]
HWTAGCWPVTLNVVMGMFNQATPDGRKTGAPLSDGISPVQSMDKSGPFATINSILKFDQATYANGTLCNMKFHPTALQGEEGDRKLRSVMEAYFDGGGMELQINVVSAETLRDAQEHPENYQDLVVRVAGFSAYFVEVFKESQDDLIRRTEMSI